jgi:hypothetical protein
MTDFIKELEEEFNTKIIHSSKFSLLDFGGFQLTNNYIDGLVVYLWGEGVHFDSDIEGESRGKYLEWYDLTNRDTREFVRIHWREWLYELETSHPELTKKTAKFLQQAYKKTLKANKDAALTYSAYRGDLKKVKALFKKDSDAYTAMIRAAEEGNLKVFRFFLENQTMNRKELSKTLADAFVGACRESFRLRGKGKLKTIGFIRKHRSKMGRQKWKRALADGLIAACSYRNNLETVRFLLKGQKKIPFHPDDQHRSPLHSAAYSGDMDLMKELLKMPNSRKAWNFSSFYETPQEAAYNQPEMKAFLEDLWMKWYKEGKL